MNTPAHLIFAATAFARRDQWKVNIAAVLGGFAPDLSLYAMAGVSLFVLQIDPQVVFGQLYFSDGWQLVFSIDNSFVLWGVGLAMAWYVKSPWAIAFCGAGVLHLVFDFPLHHDDGRAHFWPLTSWKFESPLSYWDRDHFGHIVGPIELALCAMFSAVLWRRLPDLLSRCTVAVLLLMQFAPVFIWVFVFSKN